MPYDIQWARDKGATDEQIAEYLASTRNFDLQKHIKAGFSHKDIINYLAPQKSVEAKPTVQEALPKPIVEKSPTPLVPERTVSPITPPGLINPNLMRPMERPKPSPVPAEVARETPAQPGVDLSGFPKEEPIPSHEPVRPTLKVPPVVEPKVVTSPFAARHPYLAAIPATALEMVESQLPFGKYIGEEGRKELKGDFFPPGTTTDPEKLKEIEKELVTGKKKISPYESLAKETMSAAEWAAFPTAMRAAGTIAEEVLPAVLTRFLKTPIGPWLRSLTNKERALVTQSLEDMMNKGYFEGDVLRRWNNPSWREEALRRRNKGEEYPPFAEAGKPAEPTGPKITPPGMAPEVPEVVGSTIPAPGTPAVQPATEIKAGAQLALPPGQGFQLMEPKPKTILRPKAPVGIEFKINPITGEPELVRPPGIGTEAPEPIGTTMPAGISPIAPRPQAPPVEAPPVETPQPIPPMGVGPIAPPSQPTLAEAPTTPIPQMMGIGQEMPAAAPEPAKPAQRGIAKTKENIITEIARKDMEEAAKLPPEEFPILEGKVGAVIPPEQKVVPEAIPVKEEGVGLGTLTFEKGLRRFELPSNTTVPIIEDLGIPKGGFSPAYKVRLPNGEEANITVGEKSFIKVNKPKGKRVIEPPGLQMSATQAIPPTAQHLELMPEEYPNIESVAVKQDGKIYTDHVHGEIIATNNLDPKKAIPGFVTKEGKFVEQYPKSQEDILKKIESIKGTPEKNATTQAYDIGKTLTRDQAKNIWKEYKERTKGPQPEDLSGEELQKWGDKSFIDQLYRETVAGHLGEDKFSGAFTPEEIEKKLAEAPEPSLSPTAKDQYALPGIKQGLEMKGAKEGAAPTLEGTPLGEAARKVEIEKGQPKLPMGKKENIPETPEFDIALWFNEHGKILTRKNPKTGRLESPGIDMQALSRREGATKAWGKYNPFAKAGSGKGQTFDNLFQELQGEGYTGTIDDALAQLEVRLTEGKGKPLSWEKMNATEREEFRREQEVAYWEDRKAIFDSDPNFLKDETFDSLTNNIDDEIMGWKEEQRGKGIPEEDITRRLGEAQKTIETEARPPDLEGIKKALTKSETTPVVKELTSPDLHTQISAKPYETRGPVTAFIVDGDLIRKNIDEEFTNFGQHFDKPYVPENEIWLDKEYGKNEYPYLFDNALTQRRIMSQGRPFAEALKRGNLTEQRERVRNEPPKKGEPKSQIVEDSKKGLLGTAENEKIQVFLVDGDMIRENIDSSFTEGGNDQIYKWVPKNTVIVDDQIAPEGQKFVIAHELHERDKMSTGMPYDKAHTLASEFEHEYREDPAKFEASKKYEGVKLETPTSAILIPKDIEKSIQRIEKLAIEKKKYLDEADSIAQIQPLGQPYPTFGTAIDKANDIAVKQADVWNNIRSRIIPGTSKTLWQKAIEKRLPVVDYGQEKFLEFSPEEIRGLFQKNLQESTPAETGPKGEQPESQKVFFRPALKLEGKIYSGEPNEAHFQLEQKLPEGWWNKKVENGWLDPEGNWVPIDKAWSIRARQAELSAPAEKPALSAKEPSPETPGNWSKGESRPFAFDPNSTANEGRFRLLPIESVKKDSYFRRKSSTPGVAYLMGKDKASGKEVVQAIRFDKSVMPEDKAIQWWEENKGRFEFFGGKPKTEGAIEEVAPKRGIEKTKEPEMLRTLREKAKNFNTYDEFKQWFVLEGKEPFKGVDTRVSNLARELQTNEATRARSPVDIFNEHLRKSTEFSNLKELYQDVKAKEGEVPISDFGKKIGGARKDLWKERGLSLEDVKGMTLQERETYTKKAHVWPNTPYEKFVEEGMSPGMALLVKKIKDSISVLPEISRIASTDPKLREENFKRYIELVSAIREKLPKVRTLEDIRNLGKELFPADKVSEYSSHYTDQANKDLLLLGGRTLSSAFQPRTYDLSRAEQKAEQTGFPVKQEAWQKQYDIWMIEQGAKITREGKEIVLDKGEWFVTKKGKYHVEQSGFPSREEAEAWAKDQTKSKGEILIRPYRENIERTGPDYRKGKNKTGDEILSEFGFRGGEFGNWTNQGDRQQSLNEAYDGLMDLADTLKVPPKALSLNGELEIAFGARGGGSASAHYEPGRVVINLTKTRGAGSLAHEWAHAVDDYFGRQVTGGLPGKYVSHGVSKAGEARKEMVDAWGEVMKSISDRVADKEANIATEEKGVKQITSYINSWLKPVDAFMKENPKANTDTIKDILSMLKGSKPKQWNGENVGPRELAEVLRKELAGTGYKMSKEDAGHIGNNAWHLEKAQVNLAKAEAGELVRTEKTDFLKNALAKGKGKGDNYWQRKHELFARAFESFVEDMINETGNKSDYLVHSTHESPTSPWGAIYPQGKDRVAINNAFKKWKESLKTKGEGGKALYSAIPLALPFLMGKGEENKQRKYPLRPEAPSYLPPGLGR